ncbi:gluconokinase [Sphaerobacter thermophilus]|uniref:Carbohydrate kinase FGGY n=1 Tax=Sphaerobacter thermophilus (strain ATCC 49802 / DSM 20745 / KCCM 41009 / NCIMB 13125 / S 6022) TaxID=479434 RepID=D1C4U6_SPHTD|nr:gluconokinase [Sphaerobacter thermophilus]ACZ39263.1 carbohydrate kinase FGGY [Sphaerobacter thermophilus DSM 20745]
MGGVINWAAGPGEIDVAQAEPPLVLALDVGSSSTRAALFDGRGRRLGGTLHQVPYRLETTPDGGASLDPDRLVDAVAETIDDALPAAPDAAVQAVGVSTFWHSLMGVDRDGHARTPVYTWADTRAATAAAHLRETLDAEGHHRRTGTVVHSSYPLSKLVWLQRAMPDVTAGVHRWLSFGEYLFLTLFGDATCSISMASGTGLFDQTRLTWDPTALDAAGIAPDDLSPIGDEPMVGLRPAFAARWPALAHAAWFPALGDGACSNLGSGAIGRGRLAVTIGTTGALRLLWAGDPVPPPPGLWLYRLDARHVLLGGALSEGGNLYDWVCTRFRLPDPPELDAALAAMPPDSHGLTWLPLLAGERSPGWAPHARGALAGMTLDTSPVAILRAAMEAVAYRVALVARLLDAAAPGERTIIASGSALLRNPIWLQILSDVLGRPLLAGAAPEASLTGAALMALARLPREAGGQPDLLDRIAAGPIPAAARYDPDPRRHQTYQAAIARQEALYRRLIADAG